MRDRFKMGWKYEKEEFSMPEAEALCGVSGGATSSVEWIDPFRELSLRDTHTLHTHTNTHIHTLYLEYFVPDTAEGALRKSSLTLTIFLA